jgi:hypothetical protein
MPPTAPLATLARLSPQGADWLRDQAGKIRREYGKHMGRGPILAACVDALAALKVDLTSCPNTQEITCRLMRQLRPWEYTGTGTNKETR